MMQHSNSFFKKHNLIYYFLLCALFCLSPFFLFSQEKYEYEYRDDLTYEERLQLAETYFDQHGREKGTGYKQFLRWKYWAGRALDKDGKVITQTQIDQELKQFNTLYTTPSDLLANNNYVEMGPMSATNTSTWSSALGRLTSLAFANDNTFNHIIAGAPSGGVWKTTDGGMNWTPIFDSQSTLNVWSVEISHANSQHYYAGTNNAGILKSTDGGMTWVPTNGVVGLINTIRTDPTNANIMYAVSQGSPGRIYKSTDAGNNWTLIYTHNNTLYDLEFRPGTPSTIYASGRGGFLKSTDSGSSFTNTVSPFLTSGAIMLGVSPANPDYIYAVQETGGSFHALFRSTDSGNSFTNIANNSSGNNNLLGYNLNQVGGQAPRDMDVIVSPTNINEVQVAGIESHRSFDGGVNFMQNTRWSIPSNLAFHHADVDALYYINRNGQNRIYAATDGGIYYSSDSGVNFTDLTPGIGTRQFYKIGVSKTTEDWVCGGSQDNGTGVHRNDGKWYDWLGADGMECFVSHTDHNVMFGTIQFGRPYRSIDGGNTYSQLPSPPGNGAWVAPIEQDPVDPNTLYLGFNQLHKSTNQGNSWAAISSFSPTGSNTLRNVKLAPTDPNTIYAAYQRHIYKTNNGGTTWTEISPTGFTYIINHVAIHPTNTNRIILSLSSASNGYRYIESTDGGTTWTDISANLPSIGTQCATYLGDSDDGIFVGMSPGLYYKDNTTGGNWSNIGTTRNLPNVIVAEIEIQHDNVYLSTYGRGLWKMSLINTCPADLTLNMGIASGTYSASNDISSSGTVAAGSSVIMQAGNSIQLNPNFTVEAGAEFTALINNCAMTTLQDEATYSKVLKETEIIEEVNDLKVYPNPTRRMIHIAYRLNQPQKVSVYLMDFSGKIVYRVISSDRAAGNHTESLDFKNTLTPGFYQVVLQTESQMLTKKIVYQKD